jgi:myosin heavy subunit
VYSKKEAVVSVKELGPAIKKVSVLRSLTSDLVQLDEINEPTIINLLARRYKADKIYTSVGDILIAVNPYKATGHFTPQLRKKYSKSAGLELPPHPYLVIGAGYRQLVDEGKNQSVLISGESGAGKTVTCKVCLEYLADVAGSMNGAEKKVLAANPILEAFGNAKTLRNDNSSRFGKFMEVHFEQRFKKIIGCATVSYLLEKSRLVEQSAGERSFHIFYYILQRLPTAEQRALALDGMRGSPSEAFQFLQGGGERSEADDAEEYADMAGAFAKVEISEPEKMDLYKVAAAVLCLGNINFEDKGDTGSKISSRGPKNGLKASPVKHAAQLLGVDEAKLADGLTQTVTAVLTRPFTVKEAEQARNALAKAVYGRMFQWIVDRCNKVMSFEGNQGTLFIGLLDIFGFEIFKLNRFEQLCINFANEKLQQMFNRHTFTLEEETYKKEGVPYDSVKFHDSQPLLDLLGVREVGRSRDGLFQILDEQTTLGGGTDATFLSKLVNVHKSKKDLFSDRTKSRTAFKISHYAGTVEYDTSGMVVKNGDKLVDNLLMLMNGSKSSFVGSLFAAEAKALEEKNSGGSRGGRSKLLSRTQAGIFTTQLVALQEKVDSTFPHFIRCVKPNEEKRPQLFTAPMSLEQLRFAGVFEAVEIRKKGYPFRHSHEIFFKTYRPVVKNVVTRREWDQARQSSNYVGLCKKLLGAMKKTIPASSSCLMGKSMVLYKSGTHRAIELHRLLVFNKVLALEIYLLAELFLLFFPCSLDFSY